MSIESRIRISTAMLGRPPMPLKRLLAPRGPASIPSTTAVACYLIDEKASEAMAVALVLVSALVGGCHEDGVSGASLSLVNESRNSYLARVAYALTPSETERFTLVYDVTPTSSGYLGSGGSLVGALIDVMDDDCNLLFRLEGDANVIAIKIAADGSIYEDPAGLPSELGRYQTVAECRDVD